MKKRISGFWYFFILFSLAFLLNAIGVFGQSKSLEEERRQLISIGGVYLDFTYDQYTTNVIVGGIQGMVISTLDDNSVVIDLFFIPYDGKGSVAISKLEYSDIMEEISKSLNLGITPGEIFKSNTVTMIIHKNTYEVFIKTTGNEDIYMSIRVSKL